MADESTASPPKKGNKTCCILGCMLILVLVLAPALFASGLFLTEQYQGELGDGTNPGATGGPSGTVATVDELDGLKIPYPDTLLGYEQPACDGAIIGGAAARVDPKRNEQCEGNSPYYGRTILPDGRRAFTGSGELSKGPSTPQQAMWYMNEPWPSGDYAHKRVVITSKSSGKSVVASIEETGPAASVCAGGRCAGGSPFVLEALGWTDTNDSRNRVHVAWAADQNTPLGAVTSSSEFAGGSGTLPADKGVCPFCIAKPLPVDGPNFNHNYAYPKYIILHYLDSINTKTGKAMTPEGAWQYFSSGDKHVQFVVGYDGKAYQFEPETHQPAGACGYNVVNGGVTISIENEGHFESSNSAYQYTQAQLQANIKLVKHLMDTYHIPKDKVISHKIAYQRARAAGAKLSNGSPCEARSDPGDQFMNAVLAAL